MRVLAIDTALAACAAAVLDTDHGVVASETLPMVRGHAKSLIPLTARLADKDSQNTLTPADLTAPWRGPAPRKDALHAV
jgi:tRNA threonylcarbamoyladenosine biosynthesis protein TsaB